MFKISLLCSLVFLISSFAFASDEKFVTVDAQIFQKLKSSQKLLNAKIAEKNGIALVKLSTNEIEGLSGLIHSELHRCGGFVTHDSENEALEVMKFQTNSFFAQKSIFTDYSINQQGLVEPLLRDLHEENIRATINKLANYNNRYYKSETGTASSEWIKSHWTELSKNRNDVKVEFFAHSGWPQKSVIMTILGSENPDEIVILGGHADSINQTFFGQSSAGAPGADDNASGIATITEVIRVMMLNDFKPKKTIQFMAYSAEEVGLLGSKDIANSYRSQGKKVIGKMQFDMTNVKGTESLDIVMMSDYTNKEQNDFVGKIIDEYVKVPWGYSRCGYGCSDHASWTNAGYPASMPFESNMEDLNHKIHTKDDTIEVSRGNANQAFKFSQLGISFLVELAN